MSGRFGATQITLQFRLTMPPGSAAEEVHMHGRRVMEELLELEKLNSDFTDSTVSTDAGMKTLTVELLVLGDRDIGAVLGRALDLIRTALHAAGSATPRWPSVSEQPERVNMEKAQNLAANA